MDSSSSSPRRRYLDNREKFLLRVIAPAIRGQSCPICFKALEDHRIGAVLTVCLHAFCLECIRRWSDLKRRCPLCNAAFDSWFTRISISSQKFHTERLQSLEAAKKVVAETEFDALHAPRRMIRRSRAELDIEGRRTRPLPWRRTFGRPGSVPCHVIAERKLQWRKSVYSRSLRAVPLSDGNCLEQEIARFCCRKERILDRIEPWLLRELQAILEDPDPSIIVHVASSLFIANLEENFNVLSGQLGAEDDLLAPLRPFLHNWTGLFWHELRCFAESSLTMEAYDGVVKYVKSDDVSIT